MTATISEFFEADRLEFGEQDRALRVEYVVRATRIC
jgi:hypothetical protein